MSQSAGVEELYRNFGILADAGENVSEHTSAYEGIIKAAKGSLGEKKLAAGFITRFFQHFPSLAENAMDAMLDLIEDEDAQIRRLAIKSLPDMCKGANSSSMCNRVADVLTQLLPTEDATDLGMVKTSMAVVLQMDTKNAIAGIFSQIVTEDEGGREVNIREKGIEYISTSLMSMRHKLFLNNQENEMFLLEQIKKVLVDVTGEEFETLMDVLSKLKYTSTPDGAKEVVAIISEQAELSSEFQPQDVESIDRFTTCFRQALKFCKRGSTASPFVEYLCLKVLPSLSLVAEEQTRHELLQLLAEGCLYDLEDECLQKCIEPIFMFLLDYMPLPPEGEGEAPKLQFSIVESALFTFHQLGRKVPEFLTADENAERFKDFRLRLQYFARGSQSYHAQLQAALKGKSVLDMKDEQNKLRSIALKTTANVNALIRDFFHNPPSYKAVIQLSWGAKKPESVPVERKRSTSEGAIPAKRKPSPIRFDVATDEDARRTKRETQGIYSPPKDRFSKDISNGNSFQNWRGGGGGWRRGRGSRGRRGGGTWRY